LQRIGSTRMGQHNLPSIEMLRGRFSIHVVVFALITGFGSEATAQSMTFRNTDTGATGTIQKWTVPACVASITIEAWGAQGGEGSSGPGGLGAYMKGLFSVKPGDALKVLVGQSGTQCSAEGGGGGGTFVTDGSNNPLIIAGGGGGSAPDGVGTGGSSGPCGLNGNGGGATGGCAGNGGGSEADASSGGGLLTNGGNSRKTEYECSQATGGGKSFLNEGSGGTGNCSKCSGSGAIGGFGGGGATDGFTIGGGGGGEYSGGGGGANNPNHGGGGGGSYNIGTEQSNRGGVQAGHGKVVISFSARCST
jgi:hypothetical protein